MKLPKQGEKLTPEQVNQALNIKDFRSFTIDKNWHEGLFEPWALQFGYPEGKPMYGGIIVNGEKIHIYFLNDGHQAPIILKQGQTPANYNVHPEKT